MASKSKANVPPETESSADPKAAKGNHRRGASTVTDVYKPAELSMNSPSDFLSIIAGC